MRKLVQNAKIKTNNQKQSVCTIDVEVVKFAVLWASYPGGHPYRDPKTGKVPAGYENQCAINVSAAIHGSGIEMKSFKGATVSVSEKKMAVRAQELAAWLSLQPFCGLPRSPENITGGNWEEKIKGRTGIVFFADYWRRSSSEKSPTGDHIDLWNDSRLTATGTSFFSTLGRSIGVNEILPGTEFGYSDLRGAKTILFWEVK